MTRHDEQFSRNSSQVNDAERRLPGQHVFIERLRASGNDICSAEKALEVMGDILRELYRARSLLRRKGVPRKGAPDAPLHIRKTREQALAADPSALFPLSGGSPSLSAISTAMAASCLRT